MQDAAPPSGQDDPRLGTMIGGHQVLAHVADGAMGAVYRVRHPNGSEVALKVLHDDVARDHVAVERFHREYETAGMLDHPHIVKVHDFGNAPNGAPFMTMEFLVGQELGEVLRTTGRMPVPRALRLLAQVASALEHAHSFGVIHRDLKPDNIYLCVGPDGDEVRLLDFGSVKLQVEMGQKLTAFGTTLGSPYYMSPEQAKGQSDIDGRSDTFALAAVLYECLTGTIAFEAPSVAEILMKLVNQDPPPIRSLNPQLPSGIDAVIARGLAKDKSQRYARPSELVEAAFQAFGVSGSADDWARQRESILVEALSAAQPPVQHAARHPDPHPQQQPPVHVPPSGPGGGGMPLWPWLLAAGLLVAGIAVGALVFAALTFL